MSPDRDPKAMRIFEQVADLPPAQREAALDERCAGDAALRLLVDAMLAADAAADEPFSGNAARWSEALGATVAPEPGARPGRTIGPWRIVGELGRGGMGAVYEVQRSDGAYTQKAALKLIRSAADSPAARERFLRERQTLAQLRHPHIATLLDGGFSTDGDPYFVMEYVDGQPIDQWCDARRLGLRDRIALFGQVLDAVGYAHRNLVVHRDLKPSNLLVDAHGRLKLLDFGIAKQLEDTDATATGDRALTLEYASPEQLHAAPITTATDIWQLGIVLHRLLSGTHPFGLSRDTPLPKQLRLLEREPESPTRAAARAGVDTAAVRGGLSPAGLAKELRGALSNVVQGCLRREPERRYASADALADDLRRWLEHRPLRIAPPSRAASLRLWLRRNRGLTAAGSVALLAVLAGSGAALWQAREARRESARSRESLQFLSDTLAAASPERALSKEVRVRQLLDAARAELDQRNADVEVKQPVQRMLGHLYKSLGELKIADALFDAGLKNTAPEDRSEALALATDMDDHAGILAEMERCKESLALAERAQAIRQRFSPGDETQRMRSLKALGSAHGCMRDYARAERDWTEALDIADSLPSPPIAEAVGIYNALWLLLDMQGRYDQALALADKGLAFVDRTGQAADTPLRIGLLRSKATSLYRLGKPNDALSLMQQGIALQRASVGEQGSNTAILYNDMTLILNALGRYREAAEAAQQAQRLGEEAGMGPAEAAIQLSNLGDALENAGDYRQAVQRKEQALAMLDTAGADADDPTRRKIEVMLARASGFAGRFDEARERMSRAREAARKLDGEDSVQYAYATWQMAVLEKNIGDAVAGLPILEEAAQRWAKLAPPEHTVFTQVHRIRAHFARMQGDLALAEREQRAALARFEVTQSAPAGLAAVQAEMADILAEKHEDDAARAMLRQALPVLRESVLPQEINRAAAEKLAERLGV